MYLWLFSAYYDDRQNDKYIRIAALVHTPEDVITYKRL
jgi:hypothetical protein